MIPNATGRTTEGSLPGHRIAMSFDASSLAHIMRVLTELYSDPELACIREYSTNALDSHIAAGQARPIEVETPGPLSPYLRIRDYGIGMTVRDVEEIYSRYGASTKRETNGATGMLGVGCKSALAYTSQFTLVARRDGAQCTVAISRDEDGGGSMTIVDTCGTNEPNGVEIVIPAMGSNSMPSKAAEFFQYWEPGLVLLNGKAPKKRVDGLAVTPELTLALDDSRGRYGYSRSDDPIVVMGNVPYPASGFGLASHDLGVPGDYRLVARVPIGAVDFAPSREALQDSKETRTALANVRRHFRDNIQGAVAVKINEATTPLEAVKAINRWSKLLGHNRPSSFQFQGRTIPTMLTSTTRADRFITTGLRNGRGRSSSSATDHIDITWFESAVFVTDFEPEKMTVTHKDKLLKWIEDQNFIEGVSQIVLCPRSLSLDTTWLDPARIVPWLTIKAIKLPKPERTNSGRIPGSYDIAVYRAAGSQVITHRRGVPGSELDQTKPMFWVHGDGGAQLNVLQEFHTEFTLVKLPGNRLAKWQRDVPKSISASAEVNRLYKAFMDGLTDDIRLALHIRDEGRYVHAALQSFPLRCTSGMIHDPDLARAIKLAHLLVEPVRAKRRIFRYCHTDYVLPGIEWANPLDKYPLVDAANDDLKHTVDYLNWYYAKLQDAA